MFKLYIFRLIFEHIYKNINHNFPQQHFCKILCQFNQLHIFIWLLILFNIFQINLA